MNVYCFASSRAFLDTNVSLACGCILSDLRMPVMGGLQLQAELLARGIDTPIIFITGHADVATAVEAMRRGAFDYVEKPLHGQQLLDRVNAALPQSRECHDEPCNDRRAKRVCLQLRERLQSLVSGVLPMWGQHLDLARGQVGSAINGLSSGFAELSQRLMTDAPQNGQEQSGRAIETIQRAELGLHKITDALLQTQQYRAHLLAEIDSIASTTRNTRAHGCRRTSMDAGSAESPVFTEFQTKKRTSVDALRCVFGGAGGI
nr:response regulator [Pseudomonas sp. SST3]